MKVGTERSELTRAGYITATHKSLSIRLLIEC